jgi:hypothetical protein
MSFTTKLDPGIVVHSLDFVKYNELSYFFDTNATIKHCYGLLDRFLFHGLKLKGAKDHLNNYFEQYFLPFFRQMLRNIIILGWCPYHFKKVKDPLTDETLIVPEVVPVSYMTSELEVDTRKLEYNFKFWELSERVKKPKIKVFMFSDQEMIANPSMIHSILNGTLADYRFVQQIKRFTIQSEYNRSNPPIYLMRERGTHNQSRTFHQTTGPGGGNEGPRIVDDFDTGGSVKPFRNEGGARNFNDKETPESVILSNASMNMADNIEFHQAEMKMRSSSHQRNYYNVGLDFAPQWHNNLFIVPPDMALAVPPHLPESRVDQLTMERHLSSTIYQSFGIPESMIGNIGSSQNGTQGTTSRNAKVRNDVNIMDLNSFESTIEKYKMFFKNCFAVLYSDIFQKRIPLDTIEFQPPELYTRYIENVLADTGSDKESDKKNSADKDSDKKNSTDKQPGDDIKKIKNIDNVEDKKKDNKKKENDNIDTGRESDEEDDLIKKPEQKKRKSNDDGDKKQKKQKK